MLEMMLGTVKNKSDWQGTLLTRPTWFDQNNSFGMCAGWEDGDIYIAGGRNSAGKSNRFGKYNVNTGVSTPLPNYPGVETVQLRIWTHNNKVYALLRDQFHSFSHTTNTWTKLTSYPATSPINQFGASVNVYQGIPYLFGPSSDGTANRVLYRHNVADDTLAIIKNWGKTLSNISYPAGSINNGKLYTIQGSSGTSGVIVEMTLDGNTVNEINLPVNSGSLGFNVSKNDWIYFGGGSYGNYRKVWRYNVITKIFQVLPDLPQPSYNGGYALVGGHLYIYAGYDANIQETQKDIWRYDLPND